MKVSSQPSQKFTVRWGGRTTGPFSAEELEGMAARGALSLAHEIECDGQWITFESWQAQRVRPTVPSPRVEVPKIPAPPARQVAAAPPPMPPAPQVKPLSISIRRNGQILGPFSLPQVREICAGAPLSPYDLVKIGDSDWVTAASLREIFGAPQPAFPPFSAPLSAAPTSGIPTAPAPNYAAGLAGFAALQAFQARQELHEIHEHLDQLGDLGDAAGSVDFGGFDF